MVNTAKRIPFSFCPLTMFRIRWGNSQDQAVSFLSSGEEVEALQTLRIFGTKHGEIYVGFCWVRLG